MGLAGPLPVNPQKRETEMRGRNICNIKDPGSLWWRVSRGSVAAERARNTSGNDKCYKCCTSPAAGPVPVSPQKRKTGMRNVSNATNVSARFVTFATFRTPARLGGTAVLLRDRHNGEVEKHDRK